MINEKSCGIGKTGRYWIGVDPGGTKSFGLARLYEDGRITTALVSSADEAVTLIDQEPLGAGVDAPLWWSSGRSSDRRADQWIRKTYGIRSGTVQTANSLRGAALVQGMMFVVRLRDRFPNVRITEAHPKATALSLGGWSSEKVLSLGSLNDASEHERDAIFAAIAAREGFTGRWRR
jgi:predicted nuclease with RNAse H fold